MRLAACCVLLALLAGDVRPEVYSREVRFRATAGFFVYVRFTCKKGADGKNGAPGQANVTLVNQIGDVVGNYFLTGRCPTVEDVATFLQSNHGLKITPVRSSKLRGAEVERLPAPFAERLYVADGIGTNGRREIFAIDALARQASVPIDTGDRLFGGLTLSPDGTRLYATLGAYRLGPGPEEPAYIAYIDPATHAIVDRVTVPGVPFLGKPALSPDGRWLYFTGRSDGGSGRIHVLDVAAKTLAGTFPAAPANANLTVTEVSPDGSMVCAVETSGLHCFDAATRTYLAGVSALIPAGLRPVFHPDGSLIYLLASQSSAPVVLAIDTATFTRAAAIPLPLPSPANFRLDMARLSISPDGSRLIFDEGFTGTLNIIDTHTHRIVKTLEGLTTGSLGGGIVSQ